MDMQMTSQTGSNSQLGRIRLNELRKLANGEEFSAAKLTEELFPGGLVPQQNAVALVKYLCRLPITWEEAGRAMNAILGNAYPCSFAQVEDAIEIVHLTWNVIAKTVTVTSQVDRSGCVRLWLNVIVDARDKRIVIAHRLSVARQRGTISRPLDAYIIAATLPESERKAGEQNSPSSSNRLKPVATIPSDERGATS